MFHIKGVVTIDTDEQVHSVLAVCGSDDAGKSFVAHFGRQEDEPEEVEFLPPEGESGDWQSAWRFIPGDHYVLNGSIDMEELERPEIQGAFLSQLRENYV